MNEWIPRVLVICVSLSIFLCLPLPLQAQFALKTLVEERGATSYTGLGWNVIGLGDINGDGWPDVGVNTDEYLHQFRIYYGGPGILDSIPDLIMTGGMNALMADMNGDGYKDLCLIAMSPSTSANPDTLCIYLGRPGPGMRIDTVPTIRYPSQKKGSGFGLYMVTGDLNGDGYADLAVSARYNGPGNLDGVSLGAVFVFLGRTQLDSLPDLIGQDLRPHRCVFGEGCSIADINGDGFDDLIVGSTYVDYMSNPHQYGIVNVYFGKPDWVFHPEAPDQSLDGASFGLPRIYWDPVERSDILDCNNDGLADIVVPVDTTNPRTYDVIYYSTSNGLDSTQGRILKPNTMLWMGFGIRRIGDINGDGYRDFAVPEGTYKDGIVYYYPGAISGLGSRPMGSSYYWDTYGDYGCSPPPKVDNVGDINGDGVDDVIVSSYRDKTDLFWGYFHVVAGDSKLRPAEAPPELPISLSISSAWPNPAHASCSFNVQLAAAGTVHVTIRNILGRMVHRFEERDLSAGMHTLQWDGRSDNGSMLPPGVYWYHLQTARERATGKVVLR